VGRSFTSVRLGVRFITERWERIARKLDRDNREPAGTLTKMATSHSSEAFFGCDSPLEAMVFSALIEVKRKQDCGEEHVDP
jgi:hypothetical protein